MRLLAAVAASVLSALAAVPTPAHVDTDTTFSVPAARPGEAPVPARYAPGTTPSLANPAISVIGWFQGAAGNDGAAQESAFAFKEAEIGLQAAVDPYSRADFYLGVRPDGIEIEEGFITWLALPGGGQARAGRFRSGFGRFNRTHPPETPFADRPLAALAFFGDEGLATEGVSLSALIRNPWNRYWDATAQVGTAPSAPDVHAENAAGEREEMADAGPAFASRERADLLGVARTSVFLPLGDAADLNVGASYANGPGPEARRAIEGNRAQLGGADLMLRWREPRGARHRSFLLHGEWLTHRGSHAGAPSAAGWFSYVLVQPARRWAVGARYDWTEVPGSDGHRSGALALLQFQPSEFSTLSVQARRVREHGEERDAAFLKWTFNIGPHGAHSY